MAPTWLSTGAAESSRSAKRKCVSQETFWQKDKALINSHACSRATRVFKCSVRDEEGDTMEIRTITDLCTYNVRKISTSADLRVSYLHKIGDGIQGRLLIGHSAASADFKFSECRIRLLNSRIHIVLLAVTICEQNKSPPAQFNIFSTHDNRR